MQKLILLAVLVGAAVTVTASKNKCPWVMGKYPFDEQKFVGEWKVVAGSYIIGKEDYRCTKFDYQVNKESHTISYSGIGQDGKTVKGEAFGQTLFGKAEKSANTMAVWKKVDGTLSTVYKQAVVATDYDNYAVFIACKPVFDEATKSFSRHVRAGILSRNKTLSADTMEVLKNVISSYDIDPATIQMIDHSNC